MFPFPPGADDAGDWTITFTNGWDSTSAATMNWTGVTVTLHKETMPTGCSSPNAVPWLMADPDSGTTGAGLSSISSVMVDADDKTGRAIAVRRISYSEQELADLQAGAAADLQASTPRQ